MGTGMGEKEEYMRGGESGSGVQKSKESQEFAIDGKEKGKSGEVAH